MNGTVLSSKTNTLFLIQAKGATDALWQTIDQEVTIEVARNKQQKLEKQYGPKIGEQYPLSFRLVLKTETITLTVVV